MEMKRRTFLGLGLGAMTIACGGLPGGGGSEEEGASGPGERGGKAPRGPSGGERRAVSAGGSTGHDDALAAATQFALGSTVPGFRDVGAWTGDGPAPVLVQMRLNINDFMRPDQEAASVQRWLDDIQKYGLQPCELDLTGHVLQAFVDRSPALIDRIRRERPAIMQHYRALKSRHKQSTLAEIYYTDPATMELDRSRYGPVVLIQKTFGVTPATEGGTLAGLLRAAWKKSPGQQELEALGFDKLERTDQIGHPDRIIGWSLQDIDQYGGSEQIESFFRIRRLERAVTEGRDFDTSDLEAILDDIFRWAEIVNEMGFDASAVPSLGELINTSRIPTFSVGVMGLHARDEDKARMRSRATSDKAGLIATMTTVMQGLAERTRALPTIGDELAFKLARLNPERIYVTRFAWHASNDYSVQPWAEKMWGEPGTFPYPLTPADTRPQDEQDTIIRARRMVFEALAGNDRVQAASLDRDTQWAPENSAEATYRSVLGVDFADVPDVLDPDRIDALAASQGIEASYGGSSSRG
ncbi:MAG: hypothetical protein D6798_01385, partial [Deltaproteobacteria bacterium]